MRTGVSIAVPRANQALLSKIIADRNAPQKHVWRAEIILLTAWTACKNCSLNLAYRRYSVDYARDEEVARNCKTGMRQDEFMKPWK